MKMKLCVSFQSFQASMGFLCISFVAVFLIMAHQAEGKETEQGVFEFGNPVIFVNTEDQDYQPYQLIENVDFTYIENEYMIYKSNKTKGATLSMLMYESGTADDVVLQNLGKEQYWAYVNSTGVLPSATILNTTMKETTPFHAKPDDVIEYHTALRPSFFTSETVPPIDVYFEIPAESRSFKARKTLIDYRSWGFLRWKWGRDERVDWEEIKSSYRDVSDPNEPLDWKNLVHVDNPCLPDFFLVYIFAQNKHQRPLDTKKVFLTVPAFNLEGEPEFYYLNSALCFNPDETTDCGDIEEDGIVLTNDHFVALSSQGLYISGSMNISTSDPVRREQLPLMPFVLTDPCAAYSRQIGQKCFSDASGTSTSKLQLHYAAVCALYQVPNYFDVLILSIKNKDTDATTATGHTFTILFSFTPYKQWLPLFIGAKTYNEGQIQDIVGIIFNHQLLHFDITVKLFKDDTLSCTRFVLPIPTDIINGHDSNNLVSNLSRSNGFVDFNFPYTFEVKKVNINTITMDMLFMGAQLWIAENAGPLVYISIGGFRESDEIEKCNFNHPDRYFVCRSKSTPELFVGRTAYQYGLVNVKIETIHEIQFRLGIFSKYYIMSSFLMSGIADKAIFTVSFSGNILMWYIFDPEEVNVMVDTGNHVCDSVSSTGTGMTSSEDFHRETGYVYTELDHKYCTDHWMNVRTKIPRDRPLAPKSSFRMLSMNTANFEPNRLPTHGPLTPFFIDSTTAIVYEGEVPQDKNNAGTSTVQYIGVVYIGQKIQIPISFSEIDAAEKDPKKPPVRENDEAGLPKGKIKDHRKYVGEMYVRHIKKVENVLPNFRLAMYVSIIKSLPMQPINRGMEIIIEKNSNLAIITLQKTPTSTPPPFKFDVKIHIGQSIYIPGKFSILLKGTPVVEGDGRETTVWGDATVYEIKERTEEVAAYNAWLIDFSTCEYQSKRWAADAKERKEKFDHDLALAESENKERDRVRTVKRNVNEERASLNLPAAYSSASLSRPVDVTVPEDHTVTNQHYFKPSKVPPEVEQCGDKLLNYHEKEYGPAWISGDGGCHHILLLDDNAVLKSHGGRVSLDRLDSVSFVVKIRPISEVGRLMMYRPMIVVTNSNPDILIVDKIFSREVGYQMMKINLRPKGIRMGVSTVIVRSVVASIACETPSSMTFVVAAHRAEGRRLHVTYPAPICKYDEVVERPWHLDAPHCIRSTEILDSSKKEIKRQKVVVFTTLPLNYRPPSSRGSEIPLSKNIYNAEPKEEGYKEWYQVSKESKEYDKKFCLHKQNRSQCDCSDADKMQEDPLYSDCKEKVFTVKRGAKTSIILEYDHIMRQEDMLEEFSAEPSELFVYIEEINGRQEFSVSDKYGRCADSSSKCESSDVLDEINSKPILNLGKKFLHSKSLEFTLYGTGLFHFKAGLGKFDTFEDVTGYFTLYSESQDLNDVKLMVIMFITLTFCFGLLFFGFLRVRKRLTAHLPYKAHESGKAKVE